MNGNKINGITGVLFHPTYRPYRALITGRVQPSRFPQKKPRTSLCQSAAPWQTFVATPWRRSSSRRWRVSWIWTNFVPHWVVERNMKDTWIEEFVWLESGGICCCPRSICIKRWDLSFNKDMESSSIFFVLIPSELWCSWMGWTA